MWSLLDPKKQHGKGQSTNMKASEHLIQNQCVAPQCQHPSFIYSLWPSLEYKLKTAAKQSVELTLNDFFSVLNEGLNSLPSFKVDI